MQEKLYSMKKELAELLGRDRLLKSAVKEVNKLDMIKASMVIRNPHHETIDIDRILGGELKKDLALGDYVFIENFCKLASVSSTSNSVFSSAASAGPAAATTTPAAADTPNSSSQAFTRSFNSNTDNSLIASINSCAVNLAILISSI